MNNPRCSAYVMTVVSVSWVARVVGLVFLVCLSGCQMTADAWMQGGRDDLHCYTGWDEQDSRTIEALVASDGSVAVLTRVLWVPAIAPNREYQRYYVFTPAEVRERWRRRSEDDDPKRRADLVLWVEAAKFLDPGRPAPGRFVPSGTDSRSCSPSDLPAIFKGARLVRRSLEGNTNGRLCLFADDDSTAIVKLDGEEMPIYLAGNSCRFQTPVGQVWQVFLVPIAMVGDVLYTPFYIVAFFAYGR